jgi:hypothetical protein
MSKVDAIFMGLIYLILGVPLILFSQKMPRVKNISSLVKNINSNNLQTDINTFLNYPSDVIIAGDIGIFQQLICTFSEIAPTRCDYILKQTLKPDFDENAHKINGLVLTCLIAGILLCCLAFFKFASALVPKPIKLRHRIKKLSLKRKK